MKIKILKYIFSLSLALLSGLNQPANSLLANDFQINSIKIDENANPNDIYIKLKNSVEIIDLKTINSTKPYMNINYLESRKEIALARKKLKDLNEALKLKQFPKVKDYSKQIINNIRNSQLSLMPSRVVETRGMFIDTESIPKTKSEIETLIKNLKKANFNVIYPEIFSRGYTVFPNHITDTNPLFKDINFDVLGYLINLAHKNGIEVHPWVWVFRVKSPTYGDSFIKRYSKLIAVREKTVFEDREPLFLSPAEPKAQDLILNLLKFITAKYPIDGMLLDYIRYDETLGDDTLTQKYFSRYYYAKTHHYPPEELVPGDPVYVDFQLWREAQVTKMVKTIKNGLNQIRPGIKIGVSIFRSETQGRLLKMQDWRLWADNNYLDYICPMLYTDNTKELGTWINSETDNRTRNDFFYPTLGAHKFNTSDDIFPQAGYIKQHDIPGINVFSLAFMNEQDFSDLARSVFRNPAYNPNNGVIAGIKIELAELLKWLKTISKEHSSLNTQRLKDIIIKTEKISNFVAKNNFYELEKELISLNTFIKNTHQLPQPLTQEISRSISYCSQLLKIEITKEQNSNKTFASTLPPLPIMEETRELPVSEVYKANKLPIIDGWLNDEIWERAEPLRSFYWHNGISRAEAETVVKLAHKSNSMFISFENFESNMNKVKKDSKTNNVKDILKDDSVEIYIRNSLNETYHFAINMNNSMLAEKNGITFANTFKSEIKVLKNKWVVELEIPLNNLSLKNKFKINFERNRPQELNPKAQWSPTYNISYLPARFGTVILK